MDKIKNSAGKVFYGMHFYSGVAEYAELDREPYRIYLSENTLRKMDGSFTGCPVFVEHVDEVTSDKHALKAEADGWVVESFYNPADGKHWAKFIIISDNAERAIKNGFRLSNAYIPTSFGSAGMWNGVTYDKEILDGQFEHLAIVQNPRYEESVIMTPEEFKLYNEQKSDEVKRLQNAKNKGANTMKLNIFKKTKVENAMDFESMSVTLPKSGIEKTLIQIVNEADEHEMMKDDDDAVMKQKLKMNDGEELSIEELLKKHKTINEELEKMKAKCQELEKKLEEKKKDDDKKNEDDEDGDKEKEIHVDIDSHKDEKGLPMKGPKNDDDESDLEKEEHHAKIAKELAEGEEEEVEKMKKQNHFKSLKNAHLQDFDEIAKIELSDDMVSRGQKRYGSN